MASGGDGGRAECSEATCSQCRQLFTEPKLLPCGHLLCGRCLLAWLDSCRPDGAAHCPQCGHLIVDAGTRQLKSSEEVTQSLTTDLSMEAVVRATSLITLTHDCHVCGEGVSATCLCLMCGDVLCGACKTAHTKLSALRHHRLEDLSRLSRDSALAASRPATCSEHPEDTPKFFCATHECCVCLQCLTSLHKGCGGEVEDLEEKMEEAQERMTELSDTLTTGVTDLRAALDHLDRHLQQTRQIVTAAVAQVDESHDRLQSSVSKSRLQLKEQLTQALSEVSQTLEEGKGHLQQRLDKLTSHELAVRRVQALKNYDDVRVMGPVMERRTHDLDYSVSLPSEAGAISSLRFTMDSDAVSAIEKAMGNLAKLHIFPAEIFANQLPVLLFHERHGTHVTLTKEQGAAGKVKDSRSDQGIVLSREPLHFDLLYEVRVEKWQDTYEQGSMCVGVLTVTPQSLLSLPAWSGHFKASAIVIRKNWVKNCITGSQVSSGYGAALGSLRVGSRVGVALDSTRSLHVYVDGEDQGVAATDVPRPCFALFDLCDAAKMITALPVTKLPGSQSASSPRLQSISVRETTMW